jgi:hypothetical protein
VTPPDALLRYLLDLTNGARKAAGREPVGWDVAAAQVAQAHAADMAAAGYFSHWNRDGWGPDHRYSRAGGLHVAMENIYMTRRVFAEGQPAPVLVDQAAIRTAHEAWLTSPGHRANILDPAHTHTGFGLATNAAEGTLQLTQEFTNQYVLLDPLPPSAPLGTTLEVRGRLLPGASAPLVNLAVEPDPTPLTVAQLTTQRSGPYASAAQTVQALLPRPGAGPDEWHLSIRLDHAGQQGVYHVLIWVRAHARDIHAVDHCIWVT